MNPIIYSILLSLAPIAEVRGGIPYAIASGIDPLLAFIICVIANCLVIPIVFFVLDFFHKYFYKINIYRKIFDKIIERNRNKIESKIGTKWEFIALMIFVAIPLPFTGAYTGAIIAWFFNLKRKKSYIALSLGVLIAGIIVTILSLMGLIAYNNFK